MVPDGPSQHNSHSVFRPASNGFTCRAICAGCPVVEPCLRAGMGEAFGMWGGLSPRERQQLRRRHER
ncbi:MAG: WhiB family transcriptional regulator, partial [Acidimicrobiales bacterium]